MLFRSIGAGGHQASPAAADDGAGAGSDSPSMSIDTDEDVAPAPSDSEAGGDDSDDSDSDAEMEAETLPLEAIQQATVKTAGAEDRKHKLESVSTVVAALVTGKAAGASPVFPSQRHNAEGLFALMQKQLNLGDFEDVDMYIALPNITSLYQQTVARLEDFVRWCRQDLLQHEAQIGRAHV
mgnify:CR=1 FL=1